MPVKRLRYFHYQFLQENDFTDEQDYHVSMRRRHNQDFHTWGRVQGLVVSFTASERKVTISPGMAVDSLGREIIIESNHEVDLQSHAGKSVYLVLAYKKEETDPATQAGVSGNTNTRITESFQPPKVYSAASPPAWDTSLELILAKITLNPAPPTSDGAVIKVDFSERTEAGAKIGEAAFPGLKITVPGHGNAEWPGIKGVEISTPGSGLQGIEVQSPKTSFSGSLEVKGDLLSRGNVQLGDADNDTVTIEGRVLTGHTSGKLQISAPVTITGDLSLTGSVTLPSNPTASLHAAPKQYVDAHATAVNPHSGSLAKAGDTMTGALTLFGNPTVELHAAPKQYVDGRVAKAGDSMTGALTLPSNPTAPLHAATKQYVDDRVAKAGDTMAGALSITAAGTGLNVTNNASVGGRVGIGTSAPDGPLHITGGNWDVGATEGDLKIGDATYRMKIGVAKGGGGAGDVRIRAQGGTNRLLFGSGTADVLTIQNGKVGVGTTAPGEVLEVKGNISLSGNMTLSGAIVQDDWIAPTLLNGWINYASGYNPAGYFRDKQGIVHLRGLVKMGTLVGAVANSIIFTLPLGFQPQYRELHAVQTNPNTIGRCDIDASGNVICVQGNQGWFSLDGITFRAEPESFFAVLGLAVTMQPIPIRIGG